MVENLPEPQCKLGYPVTQLPDFLTEDQFIRLGNWMDGQTMILCEGWYYDYDRKEKVPDDCGPHGTVVYRRDINRFLQGLPVDD